MCKGQMMALMTQQAGSSELGALLENGASSSEHDDEEAGGAAASENQPVSNGDFPSHIFAGSAGRIVNKPSLPE